MNERLDQYNVVWESPSRDSSGSMPLGNGDLAANVWVEENGDLLLLLGKSDAWDENSINLKLGRIRIKFSPNPFVAGEKFRQTLKLRTAEIEIMAGYLRLSIWVDARSPVIRMEALGDEPFEMEALLEMWRTKPRVIQTQTSDMFKWLGRKEGDLYPTIVWPDQVLDGPADSVTWCHHNEKRDPDPYEVNMRLQGLGGMIEKMEHPLVGRTFGASMRGDDFACRDRQTLRSKAGAKSHRLNIYAHSYRGSGVREWAEAMERLIPAVERMEENLSAREAHSRWWEEFWRRSWIYVTAGSPEESAKAFQVTRAYILQRFMNACAGAGPIKHNGSLFTVGKVDDPDFRRWGGPGFWFQNQRLIYWPMLACGDFELMRPWLEMYFESLPLQKHRTATYFKHSGAHFPETITFWGAEVSAHYGWQPFEERESPEAETPYLKYYWTGGLELVLLMCEYVAYSGKSNFALRKPVPLADAVLEFFDVHWPRDGRGKIRFEPAQSLETWHEAVNPLPEIAGLKYVLGRMLSLDEHLTTSPQREKWGRMLGELPEIPLGEKNGKRVILPAERFDKLKNSENPELYCIFPYRLFGVGKPDLQLAQDTFDVRLHVYAECWSQDDIQMALLGRAEQAKEWLVKRASDAARSDSRFPAFWNAFHDWVPDVDHGGVLMMALQLMLMQAEGDQITLLPAWPKEWNAEFKLHAPGGVIVEGSVREGELVQHRATPGTAQARISVAQKRNELR